MKRVRLLVRVGCAVVLLGLCGVTGASATNRPDPGARVPYSSLELVLDGRHARPAPVGNPARGTFAAGTASVSTPSDPAAPATGAPAQRGLTFPRALAALAARHELSDATASADSWQWSAAREAYRKLAGTRRAELGDVLNTLQGIARAGALTPGRLPALVLTLRRNRAWWSQGPLIAADQRVGFPGSHLVREFYPGQGLQIQWLGTFGAADGFVDARDGGDLSALLGEALGLAVSRGGGIAWEYDFLVRRRLSAVGQRDNRRHRGGGPHGRRGVAA